MRERFKAPDNWLPRFKALANINCETDSLECFRVSKYQVEVSLLESEFCVRAIWKININTGSMTRTL